MRKGGGEVFHDPLWIMLVVDSFSSFETGNTFH